MSRDAEWRRWASQADKDRLACALAAAGVLWAEQQRGGKRFSGKDVGAFITRLLLSGKPVPWRWPPSPTAPGTGAVTACGPEVLAAAWENAVTRFSGRCRLRVESPGRSLAETFSPDIGETLHLLQHRSVRCESVFARWPAPKSDRWQWPPRIGLLPDAAPGLAEAVAGLSPADRLASVFTLSRASGHCEILVLQGNVREAVDSLLASRLEPRASLVLIAGGAEGKGWPASLPFPSGLLRPMPGGLVVAASRVDAAQLVNGLIFHLSHNLPLDAALAMAGHEVECPLLAWLGNSLIESSQLRAVAKNLASRLDRSASVEKVVSTQKGESVQKPKPSRKPGSKMVSGKKGKPLQKPSTGIAKLAATRVTLPLEVTQPLQMAAKTVTLNELSRVFSAQIPKFQFNHESDEASMVASLAKAVNPSIAKEAAKKRDTRFIQAQVARLDSKQRIANPPCWVAAVPHTVRVRVGPSEEGWINPQGDVPFRDDLLPLAEEHHLRVVISEPNHIPKPLGRTITLPKAGKSTVASFRIVPRPGVGPFCARIAILHRNRILQTALLRGEVLPKTKATVTKGSIELEIEALVRRGLQDLEGRSRFDAAIAVSQEPDGKPRFMGLASERAVLRGMAAIQADIDAISACLSQPAVTAARFAKGLKTKDGLDLLRFLAGRGRALYNYLIEDQTLGARFQDAEYIQIISLSPDAFFPAEFIYDFGVPSSSATLCEKGMEALKSEQAGSICQAEDHQGSDNSKVCPFGFWGLRRVIERHSHLPADRDTINGDYVLQSEPASGRTDLILGGAGLFGASLKVDKGKKGATTLLFQGLCDASSLPFENVPDWTAWEASVRSHGPSILVALPHSVKRMKFGSAEYAMEIGGKELNVIAIEKRFVLKDDQAPAPLVLLLGCDTTVGGSVIDSMTGQFRRAGAGIVVGTVGSVLGVHAAKVAEDLVGAIFKEAKGTPKPLGELLRDARRRCLGRGVMMALCVVAFGDADWCVRA